MRPAVLSIVGRKGAGKSEVLASLIMLLSKRGFRIGVIKHLQRDDFEIDQPGKDTFRYRSRGADKVIVSGRKRLAVFANLKEEIPLTRLLEEFSDYHLVFLEGYLQHELPKIEIHRFGAGPPFTHIGNIVAICTDAKDDLQKEYRVPCFAQSELTQFAAWLENEWLATPRGNVHAG